MEGDRQRTLTFEAPAFNGFYDKATKEYTQLAPAYESIQAGKFLYSSTIDLSGYAMDKKTFMPYSSFEQLGGVYGMKIFGAFTEQPYIQDLTIISSVPLDNANLITGLNPHPGFINPSGSTFNRDVIIHGRSLSYTYDTSQAVAGAYANFIRNVDNMFSSLEPTAADKLYCYRLISFTLDADVSATLLTPAKRVIMPGTITSEPELEYMMRLKRSYELASDRV